MRKGTLRRVGVAGMFLAGLGATVFGLAATAQAATVLYQGDNVTVRVSGGDAAAVVSCVNDARDGIIQTQQNACLQTAQAGNVFEIDDTEIWVQTTTFPSRVLFHQSNVNVDLTGSTLNATALCLNDAQDGLIQTQRNSCTQSVFAGNIVTLQRVGVVVESE